MATILINKDNFYHNLNQIALKTGSIEKIAIVLKDNAYGHGLEIMATLASDFGIRHAVVKNREEAERIKPLFESILILGGEAVKDEVYSFAINTLNDIKKAQKGAKVELKVDTGMHRNGIAIEEIEKALEQIAKRALVLTGVMTHFRSADVMGSELFWQQKQFARVKERVSKLGYKDVRFHSHNSVALLRTRNFTEDLARVGIAVYGYAELPSPFDHYLLKPVMTLMAEKVASREVAKGERIGYGGDFIAPKEMRVSTYALGYGDGWFRGESATPYITAEQKPLLGRVSMDFIVVESEKEWIRVMDNAQKTAQHFGTISYEITTALSEKIRRIVV